MTNQIRILALVIVCVISLVAASSEWLFHELAIRSAVTGRIIRDVRWVGDKFEIITEDGRILLWTESGLPQSVIIRNDGTVVELDGSTMKVKR